MTLIVSILVFIMGLSFSGARLLTNTQIKDLDESIKADLMLKVVTDLDEAITKSEKMSKDCERKLNDTSDSCTTCQGNLPRPGQRKNLIPNAKAILLAPITGGGFLLKSIAGSLATEAVKKIAGKKIGEIASKVTSSIEKIGSYAIGGISKAVFRPVLKNLAKIKDIHKPVKKIFKGLTRGVEKGWKGVSRGVEKAAKGLVGGVKKGASELARGVKKGWKKVEDGFKSIGRVFGFGRKRRSACPSCDKLDSEDTKVIISNVCGSTYLREAADLEKQMGNMQLLYESATNTNDKIITKVEIDDATVNYDLATFVMTADVKSIEYVVNNLIRTLKFRPGFKITVSNMVSAAENILTKLYKDFV